MPTGLQVHLLPRTSAPGAQEPGGDPAGRRNCPLEHLQERKEGWHLLSACTLLPTGSLGPTGVHTLLTNQGSAKEQTPSPGWCFIHI